MSAQAKLSKAQEDIVRTLGRAGVIDFDGRRARALAVLQRANLIRQICGQGYILTEQGRRVAGELPLTAGEGQHDKAEGGQ